MSDQKNCLNCKYKRCIKGSLYCIYSPKMPINGRIVNAKTELCQQVIIQERGKCFNYANWSAAPEQGVVKDALKGAKKLFKKIKNEVDFLR